MLCPFRSRCFEAGSGSSDNMKSPGPRIIYTVRAPSAVPKFAERNAAARGRITLVWVGRGTAERSSSMLERIVVPLDGSLTAEAVLPFVRRFLHRTDSEIILVRAVIPAPVENAMMVADATLGAGRVYIREVQERLEREGVRVKSDVRVGSAIGV